MLYRIEIDRFLEDGLACTSEFEYVVKHNFYGSKWLEIYFEDNRILVVDVFNSIDIRFIPYSRS